VFQFHHLLREFSALENVAIPLRIAGMPAGDAERRAREILERVGLGARMSHRPSELSGGEQQRTAVARALVVDPAILLADEPSGNLDHANAERLHELFVQLSRDLEIAMVIVTHNRSLASRADRVLLLEDGKLVESNVGEAVP
jgi:lipoprotein-releasing system ATP-binding protein